MKEEIIEVDLEKNNEEIRDNNVNMPNFFNEFDKVMNMFYSLETGSKNPIEKIFPELVLGMKTELSQKIEIHNFFSECLEEGDIEEAIILTKEKFDLPNDYEMTINLKIIFTEKPIIRAKK